MKTKEEIVNNWLPRYTGEQLQNFGKYILLTNFSNYINLFASWNDLFKYLSEVDKGLHNNDDRWHLGLKMI
jgi:hypothetical protein